MVNSTASQQQVTMRDMNKPKSCTAGIYSQEAWRLGQGSGLADSMARDNQRAGSLQAEVGAVWLQGTSTGLEDARSWGLCWTQQQRKTLLRRRAEALGYLQPAGNSTSPRVSVQ